MRPKLSAVPRTTTPPWRFHSRGLLRLLILAVTFSLLSLGHGLWWWIGFLLLAAVLISSAIAGRSVRGSDRPASCGLRLCMCGLLRLATEFLH
ncbi:MAG: hypothetical protein C7B44_06330 [Sulfobacillus thermosulfidooxidans]|nr:MAG: hypothetical protein C7B44_06330 [Sulfobacillus thermosulfidooxidans]